MSEIVEVVQELEAVPVLTSASAPHGRALIRSAAPAAQAAVLAAGGFVAGAAVIGLANRRRGRRGARALAGRGRRGARGKSGGARSELVQILGTRSLLVDVHLLGGAER